jgi:transcriptional regulator with PAS, ATPase and Fis domain
VRAGGAAVRGRHRAGARPPVQRDRRLEPGGARRAAAAREDRQERVDRADPRRERHRQGADRARDPLPRAPRQKPFVVQNCSAFNDNLLESELFGHVRGAFTGAVKDQAGLFQVADGGTFFLDEIGDMSPALQVKLLRVLQEGTFTPVGGTKPVKVDVRIIAASHKDLAGMVAHRQFREDLFYRVNVLKITLPPLRERQADIPTLVGHFIRKHKKAAGVATEDVPRPTDSALAMLVGYPWPGNIRELENVIERALVLGGDTTEIGPELLSQRIRDAHAAPASAARSVPRELTGTLREVVEQVESEVILAGLIRTHWNKSQMAKELGITRSYLIQKCAYYGLERKE